jgi:hypothetical protein
VRNPALRHDRHKQYARKQRAYCDTLWQHAEHHRSRDRIARSGSAVKPRPCGIFELMIAAFAFDVVRAAYDEFVRDLDELRNGRGMKTQMRQKPKKQVMMPFCYPL